MSQDSREYNDVYHHGEKAIQSLAGKQLEAQSLSGVIAPALSRPSARFLVSQSFAITSSVDSGNNVWASLVIGFPGFIEILDAQSVRINFSVVPDSPLSKSIEPAVPLGLVVIDLANRTRLRLNGFVSKSSATELTLELRQVYFNCPMYIQRRSLQSLVPGQEGSFPAMTTGNEVSPQQSQWISQSDTFFVASLNSESSDADASHRGGFPGFVKVLDSRTIAFPDYSGNNMFNTLGNIHVNPKVGLIFVDFDKGSTLQLTGQAKILWEEDITSAFLGAQRVILFHLDQVVESSERDSINFEFIDYSPYNPSLPAANPPCKSEQLVPPLSDEIIQKMLEKFSS